MTRRTNERRIEHLIAGACRIVGGGDAVRSISVVTGHRLGYDELARLRAHATAEGADVTMDRDGTVVVRRCVATPTPPCEGP
jgi:hypothetical protein